MQSTHRSLSFCRRSLLPFLALSCWIALSSLQVKAQNRKGGGGTRGLSEVSSNPLVLQGQTLYNDQKYSQAVIVFTRAYKWKGSKLPDRIEALKFLAFSHIILRQYDKANDAFVKLLELKPDFQLDALAPPKFVQFLTKVRRDFNAKRQVQIEDASPSELPISQNLIVRVKIVDYMRRMRQVRLSYRLEGGTSYTPIIMTEVTKQEWAQNTPVSTNTAPTPGVNIAPNLRPKAPVVQPASAVPTKPRTLAPSKTLKEAQNKAKPSVDATRSKTDALTSEVGTAKSKAKTATEKADAVKSKAKNGLGKAKAAPNAAKSSAKSKSVGMTNAAKTAIKKSVKDTTDAVKQAAKSKAQDAKKSVGGAVTKTTEATKDKVKSASPDARTTPTETRVKAATPVAAVERYFRFQVPAYLSSNTNQAYYFEYYIEALDAKGKVVSRSGEPAKPQRIKRIFTGPGEVASKPVYKKWWFWTAIGVVVVGGAAAGITAAVLNRTPDPPPTGAAVILITGE